jgi:predicted ArsR family transcriptional regulator
MDPLDAIGDRELRETLLFARARPLPVTADELAAAHRVHRNVARSRLERLVEVGLLIPAFERRTGRTGPGAGRPAKTYRVTPELSAIEFPERRYEQLIGLIVDVLPKRARGNRLYDVGAAFGRSLAAEARLRPVKTFHTALDRVCAALGRLGYQAAVAEVSGESGVITTATCPLRPLVRAKPNSRGLDLGMWAALVAEAFKGVDTGRIACETSDCCHSDHVDCRVSVRLRPRRRSAGADA